MRKTIDALVLFSGGLDSLLSARLLTQQGLKVLCLHFYSPFFGNPAKVDHWKNEYGLDILPVDASHPFTKALLAPVHGIGKTLNPCIDCKITLLTLAREMLDATGAKFIATGEVLGQRPMSQRSDALNLISKASATREMLLRPLSAKLLPPTPMEISGIVDRERLLALSGRGRNGQLDLASEMGIKEIPTPAGGCRLTERESSRRYWPLLQSYRSSPMPLQDLIDDLNLANMGRIVFRKDSYEMLCVGKNEGDNKRICTMLKGDDFMFRLPFAGPYAIGRHARSWPESSLREACAVFVGYSQRALKSGTNLQVRLVNGEHEKTIDVYPAPSQKDWSLPSFEKIHEEIRSERKRAMNQS